MNKSVIPGALALFALSACDNTDECQKPNVVFILTDQWRASAFGYSGNPDVLTPHLDGFAGKSVNFANAVSVCPVSTPARASLLTGRYPTSTGMFINDLYLPSSELCMAEIFKAEGYNTAYLGKWHLDGHGRFNNVSLDRRQGFDYWKALECSHDYNNMPYYENDDPQIKYWEGYSPYAIADEANSYIGRHKDDDAPFLLFVSIAAPHYPHNTAPVDVVEKYKDKSLVIPPNVSENRKRQVMRELPGYYAHCTAVDAAVGSILDRLEDLGLMENTIVVFTSDHGEMMGAHDVSPKMKQLAWDESIKVPFLISYPGIGENKGKKVKAPINTPDILPSLLGLAGLDIPDTVEGEDLSGLMLNPDPEFDRASLVMGVSPFNVKPGDPYRAIRTSRYSYIVTTEGHVHLFDNVNDPYQMRNLLGNPDYKEVQSDMERTLEEELKRIGDENFKDGQYYLDKWHIYVEQGKSVNYIDFMSGKASSQTPHL